MKRTTLACLGMAAVLIAGCGGCGDTPYKRLAIAYRSLNLTARLAEQFDEAVAKWMTAEHERCKKAHKAKTPEFDRCVLPAVKLARVWTGRRAGKPTGKGVLPTLQSAQKAARIALDAAYDYVVENEAKCKKKDAPAKCSADWKKLIKPSACALVELVDRAVQIGAFSASGNKTYQLVVGLVRGFACGR